MKRQTVYLVKIPTGSGTVYVQHVDRARVVTATTAWPTDAARYTYSVALAVAHRNGGRLKIVQQ